MLKRLRVRLAAFLLRQAEAARKAADEIDARARAIGETKERS